MTPAGDQDPGLAVNSDPTAGVPLTMTVPAVNVPHWTVSEAETMVAGA
jgi:hypothetical protein